MSEITPEQVTAYEQKLATMADSLALAMSEELNFAVRVEPPSVSLLPIADLLTDPPKVLQATFSYGALGPDEGLLAFDAADAPVIAQTADGGGESGKKPSDKVDDEQMNRLAEVMQGFVNKFGAVIGTALDKPAQPGPIEASIVKLALPPAFATSGEVVEARFEYQLDGVLDGTFRFIVTPDMAVQLLDGDADVSTPAADAGVEAFQMIDIPDTAPSAAPPFRPIESYSGAPDSLPRGVDLILDIPLELTVELGRVRMLIKDVLELTSGSIVELDRLAGEPVDLLVNGRLVAKGEVVVIDDNFGVRVTEIVNQAERVAGLARR